MPYDDSPPCRWGAILLFIYMLGMGCFGIYQLHTIQVAAPPPNKEQT